MGHLEKVNFLSQKNPGRREMTMWEKFWLGWGMDHIWSSSITCDVFLTNSEFEDFLYDFIGDSGEGNGTPLQYSWLGKSHVRLLGCSPWGREELDTTERLHFHFSLWCIGKGNGNPLQCSCLETPRNGGAWWAAVYGVAQSRTRLKWLSIA